MSAWYRVPAPISSSPLSSNRNLRSSRSCRVSSASEDLPSKSPSRLPVKSATVATKSCSGPRATQAPSVFSPSINVLPWVLPSISRPSPPNRRRSKILPGPVGSPADDSPEPGTTGSPSSCQAEAPRVSKSATMLATFRPSRMLTAGAFPKAKPQHGASPGWPVEFPMPLGPSGEDLVQQTAWASAWPLPPLLLPPGRPARRPSHVARSARTSTSCSPCRPGNRTSRALHCARSPRAPRSARTPISSLSFSFPCAWARPRSAAASSSPASSPCRVPPVSRVPSPMLLPLSLPSGSLEVCSAQSWAI
mmetsp:Transcript_48400/g.137456  ORF Transcript_48400/g.137456 Transcript_48400/m.137456 type:complete len:306 (-) Transcript_48400:238-1155(-)